ncbi:hypothetical protein LX36DRAFT_151697 [Colletotrichum falcatum]|nr:hypothetical protein LX36DRAFT_151697 [Colletotrichum falcatum]
MGKTPSSRLRLLRLPFTRSWFFLSVQHSVSYLIRSAAAGSGGRKEGDTEMGNACPRVSVQRRGSPSVGVRFPLFPLSPFLALPFSSQPVQPAQQIRPVGVGVGAVPLTGHIHPPQHNTTPSAYAIHHAHPRPRRK